MHAVLAILITTTQAQAAAPSADVLLEAWTAIQPAVADQSPVPIELTQADFQAIANSRIAKRRIREEGPDRAMGAMWVPVDRKLIWVAIIDDIHDQLVSSLTEKRLGLSEQGHKLLYQHLDLPWPVQDRQLVVQIQNNPSIAATTQGRLWERSWDLADPDRMKDPDPSAVWVPMTNGAWLLFPVQDGTVVVYHARTTIGGRVPDELVTRWAMLTVDEMMEHIVERAQQISKHYIAGHEIIVGGDENPISHF